MQAAASWRSVPVPVIAGLADTRKGGTAPYRRRPLGEIFDTSHPERLPKERAPAILASIYGESDAREHAAQRARGEFALLVGDVDHGNFPLSLVADKVAAVAEGSAWVVYSTASARVDDRRWRVFLPLATPATFDDWHDAQLALVDFMGSVGIDLDTSAARPGQVSFLPNVPAEGRRADGEPLFFERASSDPDAPGLSLVKGKVADSMAAIRAQREADNAKRERIKAQAMQRNARRPISSGDGSSRIDAFNRENAVATLLERYGYERSPRHGEDWRSPFQSSGSFATRVIEGEKWISLSGSDAAMGIGERCSSGRFGDAFDLFAHFEHGGDRRAALRELHREREAMHKGEAYDPETGEFSDALKGEGAGEFSVAVKDGGEAEPTEDADGERGS